MIRKEGIGSYFHFNEIEDMEVDTIHLNFDYTIFYTGRHALLHILNTISKSKTISKIWFPSYYCQHTLNWIKKSYQNIYIYELNPFEFSEKTIDIEQFAGEDDVVLLNNYWGLSSMPKNTKRNSAIIIEDHSHGWLSKACLNSHADYCFVSLRKSLPIPLGGIYWQPKQPNLLREENNFKTDVEFYNVWHTMLKGMSLKSEYIKETNNVDPSTFLPLFYEVEEALNEKTDFVKLHESHKDCISSYINLDVIKAKEAHLDFLYREIQDTNYFKVIKRQGYTAFGLHLLFKNLNAYNSLKQFLVKNNIYPSSLWPDNLVDYKWRYFLNIHVDFRYNKFDMQYIASKINTWLNPYN